MALPLVADYWYQDFDRSLLAFELDVDCNYVSDLVLVGREPFGSIGFLSGFTNNTPFWSTKRCHNERKLLSFLDYMSFTINIFSVIFTDI